MSIETATAADGAAAGLVARNGLTEHAGVTGRYTVECRDADGNLKWRDECQNLVFNAGKQDALDKYFAGSAYTAAFYLGLVDGGSTPTYNAADTASSHAGWTENQGYSNSTRPAAAFGSATSTGGGAGSAGTGSKATSATTFNINATGTIAGCFLSTISTKGGTTGVLYSASSFTGGNRAVQSGDSLAVTYTASN